MSDEIEYVDLAVRGNLGDGYAVHRLDMDGEPVMQRFEAREGESAADAKARIREWVDGRNARYENPPTPAVNVDERMSLIAGAVATVADSRDPSEARVLAAALRDARSPLPPAVAPDPSPPKPVRLRIVSGA